MAGPTDIVVVTALGALSAACITAGLRSLVPELRLVRRMSELGASSSIGRLAERASHGLGALLIGGEADRKEIEQSLHLAGYYGHAAPAVFAWVRVGGAAACRDRIQMAPTITLPRKDDAIPFAPKQLVFCNHRMKRAACAFVRAPNHFAFS